MKRGFTAGLVAMILLIGACSDDDAAVTETTDTTTSIRFLALGDSYTIGESVSPNERWPIQLAGLLDQTAEVEIVAVTGWTTSELDAGIHESDPQGPYDLVSLLIGVNNQFRGLDAEEYRTEFVALLERSIEFAGGDPQRVIVVSIPDWGVTPFGAGYDGSRIAAELDAFNEINRSESASLGTRWVDVTGISRSSSPDLVASDGLHPSGEQYRLWAEAVLPQALEALTD